MRNYLFFYTLSEAKPQNSKRKMSELWDKNVQLNYYYFLFRGGNKNSELREKIQNYEGKKGAIHFFFITWHKQKLRIPEKNVKIVRGKKIITLFIYLFLCGGNKNSKIQRKKVRIVRRKQNSENKSLNINLRF